MNGQVTEISEFRFCSLRKYMQPLYFTLNRYAGAPKEEKREVLQKLLPQIFKRLRLFREITLKEMAARSKISEEELSAFEAGEIRASRKIELAYGRICMAMHELEFLGYRIEEFMNPTIRESREAIAGDALKQLGIMMPGVDYSNLQGRKGTLLPLPGKARSGQHFPMLSQ